LQVTGDFAVWNEGETLKRYDASTGVATTVATDADNTSNSVGPNGDVVYWTNGYQIVRVRGGTATPITSGPLPSVNPVTDGVNIVFRQKGPDFQGPWQTILFDGSNFIPLTSSSPNDPNRVLCYAVNAGWTGYCKLGSAEETQTWTRSPAGEERQTSFSRAEACSRLWVRQDRSSSVPPLKVFPAASSRFRPTLQTPQT
jgi:hypothetical protein